jgi:hypothetical protein
MRQMTQTTQMGANGFMGWVGCDPYGVVGGVGTGRYPGSVPPGHEMGMLRIPQECASCGCGGKGDAEI